MKKKNIFCVIGTRPEAIKMAPIILALQRCDWADVKILVTAQHREMLDQVLSIFNIKADFDLNIMRNNQSLADITAKILSEITKIFVSHPTDIVLAQGDTTTILATALACFYQKIPFCHVEAGLRTGDLYNPFPEEMNRIVVSRLAQLHFAPAQQAKDYLMREGISENSIHITGNTVIDALLYAANQNFLSAINLNAKKRSILLTVHRRENLGKPLLDIFRAIRQLADAREEIEVIYPVHPNPNIAKVAHELLGNHASIKLTPPLNYQDLIYTLKRCYLVLTDSGGIQEEAPALGKPVLVLRKSTERSEPIAEGVAKLVGTNSNDIIKEINYLLDNPLAYQQMARPIFPYGNGDAAIKIAKLLAGHQF